MKKILSIIFLLYIFLFVYGSVFGIGERTISVGGSSTWKNIETRAGIIEARDVRPYPVLLLSSAVTYTPGSSLSNGYTAAIGAHGNFFELKENYLDMSVSFDERETGLFRDAAGMYRVSSPFGSERVDRAMARSGSGAVLFGRMDGNIIIEVQNRNALFAAGKRIGDFSIEFWLYPFNLENGEKIVSWVSSIPLNGNNSTQRIQCIAVRNRINWSFVNFFADPGYGMPGNSSFINLELSGNAPVVPKTWSHHLIRFDSVTGMVEYLVNGRSENITYATKTRRENSEVYTPVTGNNGSFMLGETYTGLMDEFKIHSAFVGRSSVQKYYSGRMETGPIDLGDETSNVVRLDITGGRTGVNRNSIVNEFRENGKFRFSDDSEINFFIRSSNNPWLLTSKTWKVFTPGAALKDIQGRFVQIAADFYSSADGETTPYLERINIVYLPGEPPLPPRNVAAVAVDGGVQLRWRHSPDSNTEGYLVYYSSTRGELFGEDAALGISPIDVGMNNTILIDGLKNGTLYYFKVAGYNRIDRSSDRYHIGEFSAEVTARPLRQ